MTPPVRNPQPSRARSPAVSAADAESPYKSVGGVARIAAALKYSLSGLALALRIESAFRQELILAAVLVPVACLLPVSSLERLALVASIAFVLVVELLNSSIEAAVDRVSLDHHRLAGRAKDLGSAAVFVALGLCLLSWLLLATPAAYAWFLHVILTRRAPWRRSTSSSGDTPTRWTACRTSPGA